MTPRETLRAAGRGLRLGAMTGLEVSHLLVDARRHPGVFALRDAHIRRWAAGVLDALAVRRAVQYASPLAEGYLVGGRMVVSSHRSMLDIPILLSCFGGHLLSRDDLAKWPVVGRLAPLAGTLYVDRSSLASGAAALRVMTERLDAGRTVGVFAEGTTYPDDLVRPFHPGAFVAASRSGAEIVPVGMAYADPRATYFQEPFGAHARRLIAAPETLVAVRVGAPIAARGCSARALTAKVHATVQTLVDEARQSL